MNTDVLGGGVEQRERRGVLPSALSAGWIVMQRRDILDSLTHGVHPVLRWSCIVALGAAGAPNDLMPHLAEQVFLHSIYTELLAKFVIQ